MMAEKGTKKKDEFPYAKVLGALIGAGGLGTLGYRTAVRDVERAGPPTRLQERWRKEFERRLKETAIATGETNDDIARKIAHQIGEQSKKDVDMDNAIQAAIHGIVGGGMGWGIGDAESKDPAWTTGVLGGMLGGGYLSNKIIKKINSSKGKGIGKFEPTGEIIDPVEERFNNIGYALPGVVLGSIAGGQLGRYLSPFDSSGNPERAAGK